MITILTDNYTPTVKYLHDSVRQTGVAVSAVVGDNATLLSAAATDANFLIYVGDFKTLIADTFGLNLLLDKQLYKNVTDYCVKIKQNLPPQHILDRLCALPEGFSPFPMTSGLQSGCFGENNKRLIFCVPHVVTAAKQLFPTYIYKTIAKVFPVNKVLTYKIFALNSRALQEKLATLDNAKYVSQQCETISPSDFRLTVTFSKIATPAVVKIYREQLLRLMGGSIYAESDSTLAAQVVKVLSELRKTVATVESLTGGMIASKIVDIEGASKVLYEGLVTYSATAKAKRLGINPFFIDKHGVVSAEVAQAMATNLFEQRGADFSLSTTGYAGPSGEKVGLTYIGVCSQRGVRVYKFEFVGDREDIRQQASNAALFLLLKTAKNEPIELV
jgi:nicotinamide-nucleotide amidase